MFDSSGGALSARCCNLAFSMLGAINRPASRNIPAPEVTSLFIYLSSFSVFAVFRISPLSLDHKMLHY